MTHPLGCNTTRLVQDWICFSDAVFFFFFFSDGRNRYFHICESLLSCIVPADSSATKKEKPKLDVNYVCEFVLVIYCNTF